MNGTQIPAVIVVRSSLALLEECKPDASDRDDVNVVADASGRAYPAGEHVDVLVRGGDGAGVRYGGKRVEMF